MELAALLKQITPELLGRFFRAETIKRGLNYIPQVSGIHAEGMILRGKVKGSDYAPYSTVVTFTSQQSGDLPLIFRHTHCTCPVGNFCKHAVALILAAQGQNIANKPRSQIIEWTRQLAEKVAVAAPKAKKTAARRESIIYIVSIPAYQKTPELLLAKALLDETGALRGEPKDWHNYEQALLKPPGFVGEDDLPIFRQIRDQARKQTYYGPLRLKGEPGKNLFEAILATGRIWLGNDDTQTLSQLHAAGVRPGQLIWIPGERGTAPAIATQPRAGLILPLSPAYYIDTHTGEAGPVDLGLDAQTQRAVEALFELPPLTEIELPLVAAALEAVAPALPSPLSGSQASLPVLETPLLPVLRLATLAAFGMPAYRKYPRAYRAMEFDYAEPCFQYGDIRFPVTEEGQLFTGADGRHVRIKRDHAAESTALKALKKPAFLLPNSNSSVRKPCRPQHRGWRAKSAGAIFLTRWPRYCAKPVGKSNARPISATKCWKLKTGMPNSPNRKTAGSIFRSASKSKARSWNWPRY